MNDGPEPWEKRPDETGRAYAAFRLYRDLGPARRLADVPGFAARTLRGWQTTHRWNERAQAWDLEAYRLDDARRLEQIRSMDETHARAARVLITTGLRAMQNLDQLTPHQAARFVDLGTRLERATLLGEHLTPAPPVAAVPDDDDLSPLERIARELAGIA